MANIKILNLKTNCCAALAPMAGVADKAFRQICFEFGAAYTVGELTSAKAITLGDKKSASFLSVNQNGGPFGSQLFGNDPQIMAEAAKVAESFNPAFIDINMGCPAPKVAVSSGGGSALMKDPLLAAKIVEAVVKAVKVPVTVKMRAGWDEQTINAPYLASLCEKAGAAAITIHGRTRKQMYAPPVDFSVIKEVKQSVSIPVIGNGDICSFESAKQMLKETNCDFLMIGRAAMGNPWIFEQLNCEFNGLPFSKPTLEQRIEVMLRQIDMMIEFKGEKTGFLEARKHTAWYMHGLNGAANLRKICGSISCKDDIFRLIEQVRLTNN